MEVSKKILAAALVFLLCGAPQLIQAQQQSTTPAQSGSETQSPAPAPQTSAPATEPAQTPETPAQQNPEPQPQTGVTVDPAQGPLQPVPSHDEQTQTDAPVTTAPATSTQNTQPSAAQAAPPEAPRPQAPVEPQGTAAAQKGRTAGGAASQPAGTAIAPAKQRQVRSWLIRLGLIAAVGGAAGAVYGLSRKTPSLPPGATTTHTAASH